MEEKGFIVEKEIAQGYIAAERRTSISAGSGYVSMICGFGVFHLRFFGRQSLIIAGILVILGIVLLLFEFHKEKEEYKKIRKESFALGNGVLEDLERKYKQVRMIYLIVYILSILAILFIIGRSLFITFYYKACPQNDALTYILGSAALFCYVYASGVMGAYRTLLKGR